MAALGHVGGDQLQLSSCKAEGTAPLGDDRCVWSLEQVLRSLLPWAAAVGACASELQ